MAVAYLLGELSPEDHSRFESELAEDRELRAFVEDLRPVVSNLETLPEEAWEPVEPPALDLARATAESAETTLAGREDELASATRSRPGKARGPWLRWGGILAAGAALLLIGFFVGANTSEDGSPTAEPGQPLALERFGEAPPEAHGQVRMVSSEGDQMRLDVSGLKASPDGEFYELWLLGADGELIALGSFRVGEGGERTLEVPLPVDPASFEYFDVSIQPENGDPGHSGRSVLRGSTRY